jgi:putative tricarboxylic transport membrane protein
VIGLLVVSEAFLLLMRNKASPTAEPAKTDTAAPAIKSDWPEQMGRGLTEPFRHPATFFRSSLLGTFVGTIPGVGGSVAQFMAYNVAQTTSRHPEEYGHGSKEGLIATESAINAKEGGSLFPTFLFGIPGTAEMALVLAAWQIHGMQPGPLFLTNHAELAWALILGLVVANFVNSAITVGASPVLSKIPTIDVRWVAPVVLVTSCVAVYAIRQNFLDIVAVFAAGLLGLALKKYGYPVIGTVVGFVIGSVIERSFHFALQTSIGDPMVFVNSWISVALAILSLLVLIFGLRRYFRNIRRSQI